MTIDPALADRIGALATRVNHNGIRRTDPERFHAEKSDIAAELRKIEKSLRGETGRRASTSWKPGDERADTRAKANRAFR